MMVLLARMLLTYALLTGVWAQGSGLNAGLDVEAGGEGLGIEDCLIN